MTCADCSFLIRTPSEPAKGRCHGLPPQVNPSGFSQRPTVWMIDAACSLFKAKESGQQEQRQGKRK